MLTQTRFRRFFTTTTLTLLLLLFIQISHIQQVKAIGGGLIDASFAPPQTYPPLDVESEDLAFQTGGRVLAVGRFSTSDATTQDSPLYRFRPTGELDSNFQPYYPEGKKARAVAVFPDNTIIYAYFKFFPGQYSGAGFAKLLENGAQDTSFSQQFPMTGSVSALVALPDNKTLVTGDIVENTPVPIARRMVRLNPDGSLDTTFNGLGAGQTRRPKVLSDGRIYVIRTLGFTANTLERYNADGTLDASFTPTPFSVRDYAVLPDGKIAVGSGSVVLRLNTNGSTDTTYNAQNTLTPITLAAQADGRVIINGKERLLPNGVRDSGYTFSYAYADNNGIRAYPQADGNIFMRGLFSVWNVTRGIMRVRGDHSPSRRKALDYDGDGKTDIAVYRPSEGMWYILNSSNGSISYIRFGLPEDKPVPGDYDGDGKGDIAVFRPSTSVWYRLNSSNGQFFARQFGLNGDIQVQQDYDGDGKDDLAVYRPSAVSPTWHWVNSSNGSVGSYADFIGRPIPDDYNGDGKADLAVWNIDTGVWAMRDPRLSAVSFPAAISRPYYYYDGDFAVPADYNGDGLPEMAIWRQAAGGLYGLTSATFWNTSFYTRWGIPGDIPCPGDYNGDGKDDFCLFRPATGDWWITGVESPNFQMALHFGAPGDIPIPSAFTK